MTYLVLARKWRPRSFDTLVGQDHVVRALTHALETQRLHHAWLFTGTRGVGKTTLSRILAKSLNCEKGITAHPCGQCRACTEIDAGRYVDYVELDAASNRGVDEMTQLLEQAVYAPGSARFKVYMIDEVHMLSGHAFNAMLKTLEEPPPHVKFILATTDPQKIPVTVLSRCLQFNLKHMTVDAIVAYLQTVLAEEGLAYEAPALRLLGQAAGGSMRDALSLADQAIAYSAGNLTLEAVRGMLGTIDQRHLIRLLQALVAGLAADVVGVADELAARGLSYAGALADLAVLLSHIAIQQRVPGTLPEGDPMAAEIEALAAAMHPDLVQLFYSIAVHSRSELALAPDEYAGFIMACLRMLSLTPPSTEPSPRSTEQSPRSTEPSPRATESTAHLTEPAPRGEQALSHTIAGPAAETAAPADDGPDTPAWEDLPANDRPAAGGDAGMQPGARGASSGMQNPAACPQATDQQAASFDMPSQAGEAASGREAHSQSPDTPVAEPEMPIEAPQTAPEALIAAPTVPDEEPFAANGAAAPDDDRPAADATTAPDDDRPVAHDAIAPDDDRLAAYDSAAPDASFDVPAEAFDDVQSVGAADDGWEPVMDDSGFDAAPLAALPRADVSAKKSKPRLGRMSAQDWPALAASLPLTGLAAELARQSEWVGVDGDCVTLRVAIRSLAARKGQARLRTVLTEHFGKVVNLAVEFGVTGSDTAHAVEQERRAERQKEAESAVAGDPFVRSLIEEFGARVMPGSIAALDEEKVA